MITLYQCDDCGTRYHSEKQCLYCEAQHQEWKQYQVVFVDEEVFNQIQKISESIANKGTKVLFNRGGSEDRGYLFHLSDIDQIGEANPDIVPYISYRHDFQMPYLETLDQGDPYV